MKTIINNSEKLEKNELDVITNKVRALIIDNSNRILVIKYADIFMLPGGKVDENENCEDALIRELSEELGIDFEINDLNKFIQYDNYLKDYPLADNNIKVNKLNSTTYYIIKTNKKIDNSKLKLTEREKDNNFSIIQMDLNNAINEIENYVSNNPRNSFFKDELINVLEEFNNNELIDLHTHTNYSDGDLSPMELIKLAIEKGIGILAITDHDTLEGVKKIDRTNSLIVDSGIKIINGIEMTAKVDKGRMHILGYDIDINDKKLNNKMIEFKDNSINSVLSTMEQIKRDYGIVFGYEDIKQMINANHNLGRVDIAKLCIKYGYANTVQEAFDKYLIDAYNKIRVGKKGISYQECIELILNSGGIPVLAHPKSLELSEKELLILIKKMISFGLQGIEVYHSSHSEEEMKLYLDIANKYNLLVSGGSDFHGKTVKPDVEIGTGKNNLKIKKLTLLDKINFC